LKTNSDLSSEFVIPISYGSTEVFETGKWSFQRPQTAFMTAPCQEACPAGINIPQFLSLAHEGRMDEALLTILMENPLPGICGRVCFHPCEIYCNRVQYDEAVSIHEMERYVSDSPSNQIESIQPMMNEATRRVAIVGAGPAGLSCAYFLSLLGHRVVIYEAKKEPGGVMRWGIPAYRLPKSILKREIRRIMTLPIEMKMGVTLGRDVPFEELNRYDAIFLSPGAGMNAPLSIEGEDLKKVRRGGEFLERINSKEKIHLGKETIVIGGGNTAMDVARSALRLGSKVTVAYRRTRNEMPALQDEIVEAEEEGVRFEFLIQPVKITLLKNRKLTIKFQRMKLSHLDQSGRPQAIPVKGKFITLEADHLVTAVGERADLSWIPQALIKNDLIDPSPSPKIFAGGDAVSQPRTIVTAIASGKRAAISIDLFFRGKEVSDNLSKISVGHKGSLSMEAYLQGRDNGRWPGKKVVSYQQINTLYFEPSKRVRMRKLNRDKRLRGFSEVNLGFTSEEASFSSSRCFSCGTCNYCYNCYFFCPEGVILLDPVQKTRIVDFEHCKGCGTCAKSCPRNAVEMKELS
jgi:NADPH-dependent glutamate synthase beta subunit-like oxidoreductase/Pyruvate/2-oxoacid:ferredoxin oxidoreductase delta subunit